MDVSQLPVPVVAGPNHLERRPKLGRRQLAASIVSDTRSFSRPVRFSSASFAPAMLGTSGCAPGWPGSSSSKPCSSLDHAPSTPAQPFCRSLACAALPCRRGSEEPAAGDRLRRFPPRGFGAVTQPVPYEAKQTGAHCAPLSHHLALGYCAEARRLPGIRVWRRSRSKSPCRARPDRDPCAERSRTAPECPSPECLRRRSLCPQPRRRG